MDSDDDKLEEYSKLADTLRKADKGAAGLYLAAAEAIENLVAQAKEASEDF